MLPNPHMLKPLTFTDQEQEIYFSWYEEVGSHILTEE